MMDNCNRFISPFIESQFPAIYKENGQELIALITAYYEFEEQTKYQFLNASSCMAEKDDIDTTLDEFVVFFKSKYMKDMPFDNATTNRFLVKHITDLYKSKGTERSLKALMQLMFGDDAATEVYYPDSDVLRPSHSKWWQPRYLEISYNINNKALIGKTVTGSISGAKGFVEQIITKRVNGQLIDVVYLTNMRGDFVNNDSLVSDDATVIKPVVKASLMSIEITDGGLGSSSIGELFDVVSSNGVSALASSTALTPIDYSVKFAINPLKPYNFGYSATIDADGNPIVNSPTKIIVSDLVLGIANSGYVEGDVLEDSNGAVIGTVMESDSTRVWLTGTTGPTSWKPLFDNTIVNQNGLSGKVTRVYNGSGATFEILPSSLTDIQSVTLGTDIIGSNNIFNIVYPVVPLNSADFGFPKTVVPAGEVIGTVIDDALGSITIDVGRVTELSKINQGSGYDTDIKVKVVNILLVGKSVYDNVMTVSNTVNLQVGDAVKQTVAGNVMTGIITSIAGNKVTVMPTIYGNKFKTTTPIFTINSSVQFVASKITNDFTTPVMGSNLTVAGSVNAIEGKVSNVRMIVSGIGYKDGDTVTLVSRDTGNTLTGIARLGGSGLSEGKWLTTTSHLNWSTYIHDNDYYQEYSYEIRSSRGLADYEDVVKNIVHPSGTKMFGKVVKETVFNESYSYAACLSTDLANSICGDTLEIF